VIAKPQRCRRVALLLVQDLQVFRFDASQKHLHANQWTVAPADTASSDRDEPPPATAQ